MKVRESMMTFLFGLMILGAGSARGDQLLRVSHQWPGEKGDIRDEMVRIIAREVEAARVGVRIEIYPVKTLVQPKEQWPALTQGELDIAVLPLDYASGRHPQFSATLMPGLVKNHEHATRLNDSPFMDEIKKIINDAGVIVLADAWLAGGIGSTKKCILYPDDARGQVMRAAGPAFEQMLAAAGASIASMPSSEIYTAMQTGVLDAAITSSSSFVSYRIDEQVKCLTAPGEHALWFMYEPVLMSRRSWDQLTPTQQGALRAASQRAEEYFFEEAKAIDAKMEEAFRDAGVEVVHMSEAQLNEWKALAKETSYRQFADSVPGGGELIEKALAVP